MNRSIKTIGKSTLGVVAVGLAASAVYGLGPAADAAPRPLGPVVAAAPVAQVGDSPRNWPDLQRGSRGAKVEAVQQLLSDRGYPTKVDGIYGRATAASVTAFQKANGLRATGTMTDRTFERLLPRVSRGDRGREVRAVQRLLGTTGHPVAIDGVFGARTRAAVLARQQETGLVRDGVVGPRTWFVLLWRDAHIDW